MCDGSGCRTQILHRAGRELVFTVVLVAAMSFAWPRGALLTVLGSTLLCASACTSPAATGGGSPAPALTPGYSRAIKTSHTKELLEALQQFGDGPDGKMTVDFKGLTVSYEKTGNDVVVRQNDGKTVTLPVADFKKETVQKVEADRLESCRLNVKIIATTLEVYSTDNRGAYPPTLAKLMPDYLKSIPTCPSAGKDTYSKTFKSASNPDAYTVMCTGDWHLKAGGYPNFPQWTNARGPIDAPVPMTDTQASPVAEPTKISE